MNPVESAPGWRQLVPDEASVAALAARFARCVQAPLVMFLTGDLGAGKTTFARAFIQALGYSGYVKSPSYGLLESYLVAGMSILHLDLYRIEDPEELEFLALRDLFASDTILLVEWPEKGLGGLPPADVHLQFGETNDMRYIKFCVNTPAGEALKQAVLQTH